MEIMITALYNREKGNFVKTFVATCTRAYVLFLLITCLSCSGSSGSDTSSPLDIPAPVAHLTITTPDSEGVSRVTAAKNYADAGTSVTVTATGGTSSSLTRKTLTKASVRNTTTATATVAADGSFQVEIVASLTDTITVTYTLSGTLSETDYDVPEDNAAFPLEVDLLDVSVDPTLDLAMVLASDGTDGIVYVGNLSNGSLATTTTLSGASDVTRIATNPKNGYYYALDAVNGVVWEVNANTGTTSSKSISNIVDLEASTTSNYLIVSHSSGSNAASYYNPSAGTTTSISITTDTGATHDSSSYVDTGFDGTRDKCAIVSLMSDDIYYITSYNIPDSTSITQVTSTQLPDLGIPGGMAMFSDGSEALITDFENDVLLRVNLSTDTITEIEVGSAPIGVGISSDDATAYVVNSFDDKVSLIDLATDEVSSTEDVGLFPTEIAVDNAGVTVINTGDVTALIF